MPDTFGHALFRNLESNESIYIRIYTAYNVAMLKSLQEIGLCWIEGKSSKKPAEG